jgi:predicted transglutaminase-like cysteine proteinase
MTSSAVDLPDWQRGVLATMRSDPLEQLQAVTNYVHLRVGYVDDPEDIWQLPLDTLTDHSGDCEDFAFAKYALLRAGGWPPERLRVGYGHTSAYGKPLAHMVTLAYLAGEDEPLVLDNLGDAPKRLSERPDLKLKFSLDEDTAYAGPEKSAVRTTARLRKWDDYVVRLRASGVLEPPQI